ncbi:gliding motility-associated peptidyl-prolyl isomerase GldI [Tenacibaculum sp. Bg11-29]|uniref:gliding motility-associated peptidyl-prolyl isomerase GldI n=1 Tax=Tenacibaculum sp. Bg11-29 TaxID=2058306 RepID=UPI000C325AED|nr:gliding motility-associated peptidyl-prolyl isomerase GldI [Tenacibaculum sp. Bg11-29]PKH50747.1 gliding motility-associated peptidyl-prolyl isomerase GldI [Tenacibaculum sp. Bg11-29]
MKLKIIFFLVVILGVVSCKEPEARRPNKQGTTNFYNEVVKKNKKLNALEKKRLENFISKDTVNQYTVSKNGFWYTYVVKDSLNTLKPKKEDVVLISFDISDINGNILYRRQERNYKVDKEDFIPALQDGIKLMRKGETITYIIPSYSAFGITGDGNKIGVRQPIKSTVTLIEIK